MRWEYPQPNDKRIVKKFLFLPMVIRGEGRWFEFVTIEQKYSVGEWVDVKFID